MFRNQIMLTREGRKLSYESAGRAVLKGFGLTNNPEARIIVSKVVAEIREQARQAYLLSNRFTTEHGPEYKDQVVGEARSSYWYVPAGRGEQRGPRWERFRNTLISRNADFVDALDVQSDSVVGSLAEPYRRGVKKKGLVLGHVQSGKTANYAAVIAKAADAGYKLIIVFSGMYTNLRRQTQSRLDQDLGIPSDLFAELTTVTEDIGSVHGSNAMLASTIPVVAVVKKNHKRLEQVRDLLRDQTDRTREELQILIIDDEADQATPNASKDVLEQSTAINRLMKEIWSEVKTGTYVGYTATPFANVFMNPDDENELYPADFIHIIPRSKDYYGAERIFGRDAFSETDKSVEGLDMVRKVPDFDSDLLKPPTKRAAQLDYNPQVPSSLSDAISWFIVSTAISRARGQDSHRSMLVHVTHYTDPHFALAQCIRRFIAQLTPSAAELYESYRAESHRASEVTTAPMPSFNTVMNYLGDVLRELHVVVDNGSSDDRLDYTKVDIEGKVVPQTVIAVGGATLSRGLTLEGLTVSYFTRTSNKYDTLLQMGRWFGYRNGYEDLPRIWMPTELQKDFRFLSGIEEQLRRDILDMVRNGISPRQLGVRVRNHSGRLDITAKMGAARAVSLSYSGERKQTISFEEDDRERLEHNLVLTKELLKEVGQERFATTSTGSNRRIAKQVDSSIVARYLGQYDFFKDHASMDGRLMAKWITEQANSSKWNIVVMGPADNQTPSMAHGVDLGFPELSAYVNRAPLRQFEDRANIKALLSDSDWVSDLEPDLIAEGREAGWSNMKIRRQNHVSDGLLMVFPIDPKSVPMGVSLLNPDSDGLSRSRRNMRAHAPIIGLGIIFPPSTGDGIKIEDADYYSVSPSDWGGVPDDVGLPSDDEGDFMPSGFLR